MGGQPIREIVGRETAQTLIAIVTLELDAIAPVAVHRDTRHIAQQRLVQGCLDQPGLFAAGALGMTVRDHLCRHHKGGIRCLQRAQGHPAEVLACQLPFEDDVVHDTLVGKRKVGGLDRHRFVEADLHVARAKPFTQRLLQGLGV